VHLKGVIVRLFGIAVAASFPSFQAIGDDSEVSNPASVFVEKNGAKLVEDKIPDDGSNKNPFGKFVSKSGLYDDAQGRVVRLSSEEIVPFKKLGHSPRTGTKFAHYRSSIARFRMVSDCLIEVERLKPEPDLAAIDWDQIDSDEQAEVCLFRVASSYGDAEAMEAWFEAQGLSLLGRSNSSFLTPPTYSTGAGRLIDERGVLYSSGWLNHLIIRFLAHAVSLSVRYTEDGEIYGTSAGYTYL